MNDSTTIITELPQKKKKRKESINGLEKTRCKDIKENGIEEHLCAEEHIDEGTVGTVHKKKKKREICLEGSDEGAVNGIPVCDVGTENDNTNMVEELSRSHRKKKRKSNAEHSDDKKRLNNATEEHVDMNCSMTEEHVDTPHTKKKKNKKIDLDESVGKVCDEVAHVKNNANACEDESTEVPRKKKKKKRVEKDENSEQIFDDSANLEGKSFNAVEDEDVRASGKKKHCLNTMDEDVQMTYEDRGGSQNVGEENNAVCNELSDIGVTEEENAQIAGKKKKKRKIQDKEENESGLLETEMEGIVPGSDTSVAVREKKMEKDTNLEGEEDGQVPQAAKDPSIDEVMETQESTLASGTAAEPESAKGMENSAIPNELEGDGSYPIEGFTFIDKVKETRKSKVDRVLPDWLSHPTTVSVNLADGAPLDSLAGMDPMLLKRLHKMKIKRFFPIQTAVIPELITSSKSISMRYRPRDICVCAPTGSGKTLAYVLPIVQALKSRVVPRLRALFLLPTQELAKQVLRVVEKYIKFTTLKVCLATGSHEMKEEQEMLVREDSVGICSADILVATPGRLADHIDNTKGLSFKYLRFLVVDEADLFLSRSGGDMMLKVEQLKKEIHRPAPDNGIICGGFKPKGSMCLPEPYLQQILISATLMHNPEKLQIFDLYMPKLFIASNESSISTGMQMVAPYLRPQELLEQYVMIDSTVKPLVLYHLIHTYNLSRVLVFTKSTMATHTLSIVLAAMSEKYTVAKFSKEESKRKSILARFASGKIDILISSDAMARGIDVNVDQVVSYDVPSVQTYVHRIGRTGRAGRQGFALSLVEDTPEAKRGFNAILVSCKDRLTKIQVKQNQLEKYTSLYQNALATLKEKISKEKRMKRAPPKRVKIKKAKFSKRKVKKTNSVQ